MSGFPAERQHIQSAYSRLQAKYTGDDSRYAPTASGKAGKRDPADRMQRDKHDLGELHRRLLQASTDRCDTREEKVKVQAALDRGLQDLREFRLNRSWLTDDSQLGSSSRNIVKDYEDSIRALRRKADGLMYKMGDVWVTDWAQQPMGTYTQSQGYPVSSQGTHYPVSQAYMPVQQYLPTGCAPPNHVPADLITQGVHTLGDVESRLEDRLSDLGNKFGNLNPFK